MSKEEHIIYSLDDDQEFQHILKMRLQSFLGKVTFHTSHSLKEAKDFFSKNPPKFDLIFIDEHLPDGRGIDLLKENIFNTQAVISISSDPNPELPSSAYNAGAMYFLSKTQIRDALFTPLVQGVIDRNRVQRKLTNSEIKEAKLSTVKKLISTLKHEINNPLGAVLGAAYLMKKSDGASKEQVESAELVEKSANRINHVLKELCDAVELDSVSKANEEVFHIPGDKEWKGNKE